MKVKDIMSKSVISLQPYNTIKDAAVLMYEHNIGMIPIVDENNYPLGVVTDRDIVVRGIAHNYDEKTQLDNIMTTNLITISPDDKVPVATHIMGQRQVRRLLVIDKDEKLIGILAMADISTIPENDTKAGVALSQISLESTDVESNPYHGTDVRDFPL